MKGLLVVLGLVLAGLGVLWILQGTNVLKAGFMAGQMQYVYLGVVALIAGVVLLVFASRRRGAVG